MDDGWLLTRCLVPTSNLRARCRGTRRRAGSARPRRGGDWRRAARCRRRGESVVREHRPREHVDGVQRDPGRLRRADAGLRRSARRAVPRDPGREHDDRDRPGGAREARARSAGRAGRAGGDGWCATGARARSASAEVVVEGDLVRLEAGEQVVADGQLVEAEGWRSTRRSSPASPSRCGATGDEMRSGSFAVEGAGAYVVDGGGAGQLRRARGGRRAAFRHPRSPLERAVNRLLFVPGRR